MQANAYARRVVRSVIVFAVAMLFLVSFSGCKYSDVLTQLIEDPVNGEVDKNQEPRYELNPNAETERELTSLIISDTDRVDEQYRNLPIFDSQVPAQDTTEQRKNNTNTDNKQQASKGNEKGETDEKNNETGTGEEMTQTQSGTTEGESAGDSTSDQTTDQLGDGAQDGIAGGGAGGNKLTYDASGTVEDLPEVNSIAAVGQYATIVQMLAGKGGLAATDANWKEEVQNRGVFPGEGVEEVPAVWTGNHATGYALDIESLIAAKPECVLVDNADVMLDAEQRERLQAAGIIAVTVPVLGSTDTPDADIKQAVAVVGQMLSFARTTYDVSSQVTTYNSMHDGVIQNCLDANGGYSYKTILDTSYAGIYQGTSINGMETTSFSSERITTAFIDSLAEVFVPTATAKRSYSEGTLEHLNGQTVDVAGGIGMSVQGKSNEFVLLDYYMQVSGVVDNSFDGSKPTVSGSGDGQAYMIIPGFAEDISLNANYLQRNSYSALWYKPNGTNWLTVGDAGFPGVLVRNEAIAGYIASSRDDSDGIYNVGQPYWVRVVPEGMAGSWADGTVESFLASSWIYDIARGNGVSDACREDMRAFYETFYRTSDISMANPYFDKAL